MADHSTLTALEKRLEELKGSKNLPAESRDKEMKRVRKEIRKLKDSLGIDRTRGHALPREKGPRTKSDKDESATSAASRRAIRKTRVKEEDRPIEFLGEIPSEYFDSLLNQELQDLRGTDILHQEAGYGFPIEVVSHDRASVQDLLTKFEKRWKRAPHWFTTMSQGSIQILVLGPASLPVTDIA